MVNRVILIGRLTHDPELRYTQNGGVAVTRFSLAVNRKFTNQNGEREADFRMRAGKPSPSGLG